MSLREEIAEDSKPKRHGCGVCAWIATRPDDEDWPGILADPALGHSAIFRAMKARGYGAGSSKPVESHRNDEHS